VHTQTPKNSTGVGINDVLLVYDNTIQGTVFAVAGCVAFSSIFIISAPFVGMQVYRF
jgi:hypothetical protein